MARWFVVPSILIGAAASASAQDSTKTWSNDQLTTISRNLLAKAASNPIGVATETIVQTPGHYAMVVARLHTGEAEEHDLWTDEIVIRQGEVELLTGGTIINRRATGAPGEFRGTDLANATVRRLRPGDVVEVPAGVPHMMRVLPGGPVVTLSLKVK